MVSKLFRSYIPVSKNLLSVHRHYIYLLTYYIHVTVEVLVFSSGIPADRLAQPLWCMHATLKTTAGGCLIDCESQILSSCLILFI